MKRSALLFCLLVAFVATSALCVRAQVDNRNYLYVSNHNLRTDDQSGIVRVDKRTGEQTLITEGGQFSNRDLFGIMAESPTTLIGLEQSSRKIVRIDVTTGQQSLVVQDGALDSPCFGSIGPDGFLYVSNVGWMGAPGGILRVNLTTGAFTAVTNGGRPGQSVFHPNGFLYYVGTTPDSSQHWVSKADVSTGAVTLVSSGGFIVRGGGLAVDTDGSLLMADFGTFASGDSRIIRIDPNTGAQSLFSAGVGANQLVGVWGDDAGQVFALDSGNPGGSGAVFRVDRGTGILTLLTRDGFLWGTASFVELPPAHSECDELRAQLEGANATIAALTAQLQQLTTDKANLQQQLAAANQLNSQLTADKLALEASLVAANSQNAQLQADKTALQQSLAAANAQITQLTADKLALQQQLAAASVQITQLTAANASLQQQLAAANAAITQLSAQVAQLTTANASLQQQLATATASLAAVNTSLAALEADFRREFSNPGFVVPGASTDARVRALIDAVIGLNRGRKLDVYSPLK